MNPWGAIGNSPWGGRHSLHVHNARKVAVQTTVTVFEQSVVTEPFPSAMTHRSNDVFTDDGSLLLQKGNAPLRSIYPE